VIKKKAFCKNSALLKKVICKQNLALLKKVICKQNLALLKKVICKKNLALFLREEIKSKREFPKLFHKQTHQSWIFLQKNFK